MAETVKQPVTRLFYNICISFLITYKEIAINKTKTNLILRVPASHSQKHIVPSAPVEDKYLFEPLHSGENWKGEQGEKKRRKGQYSDNTVLLRITFSLQNNLPGLLEKHCGFSFPTVQTVQYQATPNRKLSKLFSSDCSFYSPYWYSESQSAKQSYFITELSTCTMQF